MMKEQENNTVYSTHTYKRYEKVETSIARRVMLPLLSTRKYKEKLNANVLAAVDYVHTASTVHLLSMYEYKYNTSKAKALTNRASVKVTPKNVRGMECDRPIA